MTMEMVWVRINFSIDGREQAMLLLLSDLNVRIGLYLNYPFCVLMIHGITWRRDSRPAVKCGVPCRQSRSFKQHSAS